VDFVVHLFHPALRQFYQLERLWSDAEAVALEQHEALERAVKEGRARRGDAAPPADRGERLQGEGEGEQEDRRLREARRSQGDDEPQDADTQRALP
jgi:hypothetical protein